MVGIDVLINKSNAATQRPGHTHETVAAYFEYACAAEQWLADTAMHSSAPGSRQCSTECVGACGALRILRRSIVRYLLASKGVQWDELAPERCVAPLVKATSVAQLEIESCWPPREAQEEWTVPWLEWPDCQVGFPIDYARYQAVVRRWCERWVLPAGRLLVVGMRTGGSYLAPIWAAELHRACRGEYVTVRAAQENAGLSMIREFAKSPSLHALPHLGEDVGSALIIDDLLGSGGTLRFGVHALGGIGVAKPDVRIAVCCSAKQDTVSEAVGLPTSQLYVVGRSVCRAEDVGWAAAQVLGARGRPRVTALPPSYYDGYAAALAGMTWAEFRTPGMASRRRRYLIQLPDGLPVVAKYIGWGVWADSELERLRAAAHSVDIRGIRGGFLFEEWAEGAPAAFGEADGYGWSDLAVLAETMPVPATQVRNAGFVELAGSWWAGWRAFGIERLPPWSRVASRLRGLDAYPSGRAPDNQGHWHIVRTVDGTLLRLHRELGHTYRRIDPVEDMAGLFVELGFSRGQRFALRQHYEELHGVRIDSRRLLAGALRYVQRTVVHYRRAESRAATVARGAMPRPLMDLRRIGFVHGSGRIICELLADM